MTIFQEKRTIILLGLLMLANLGLFMLPSFQGSINLITANAPELQIPDMRLSYSFDEINNFLTMIGTEGREAYQFMHLTSDLAFPIIYGLFVFTIIVRLTSEMNLGVKYLPLIAFIATFFDLAENFTLYAITSQYPNFQPFLTTLANVFTLGKFSAIGINLILIIYLGMMKTRRGTKPPMGYKPN